MFRFLIDRAVSDLLGEGLRSRGHEVDYLSMDGLLADDGSSLRARLVADGTVLVGAWSERVFDRLLALCPAEACMLFVSGTDIPCALKRLDRLLGHKPYLFQKGCTVFVSNLKLFADDTVSPKVTGFLADDGWEVGRFDDRAPLTLSGKDIVLLSADWALPRRTARLEGPRPPVIIISPELAGKERHVADRVCEIMDCRANVLSENAVVLLAAGMDRMVCGSDRVT